MVSVPRPIHRICLLDVGYISAIFRLYFLAAVMSPATRQTGKPSLLGWTTASASKQPDTPATSSSSNSPNSSSSSNPPNPPNNYFEIVPIFYENDYLRAYHQGDLSQFTVAYNPSTSGSSRTRPFSPLPVPSPKNWPHYGRSLSQHRRP